MISKAQDTLINYTTTNTGDVQLLNGIANGFSFFNRVGSQVSNTRCEYRYALDNTLNDVAAITKIAFVWDSQPDGTLPAYTDIFQDSTGFSDYTSPENWGNGHRFTILQEFYVNLNMGEVLTFADMDELSLRGLVSTYTGSAGAMANVTSGALYHVTCSDKAVGSSPTFRQTSRVYFYDN